MSLSERERNFLTKAFDIVNSENPLQEERVRSESKIDKFPENSLIISLSGEHIKIIFKKETHKISLFEGRTQINKVIHNVFDFIIKHLHEITEIYIDKSSLRRLSTETEQLIHDEIEIIGNILAQIRETRPKLIIFTK
ncbi:MAG: hypothetical protein N4A36_00160 [Candidatus Gracilibacteria bacterium]|jgi:hypothetical protein|nr:hypothetical protein [Candidatus Gracilibacteria bacterium]